MHVDQIGVSVGLALTPVVVLTLVLIATRRRHHTTTTARRPATTTMTHHSDNDPDRPLDRQRLPVRLTHPPSPPTSPRPQECDRATFAEREFERVGGGTQQAVVAQQVHLDAAEAVRTHLRSQTAGQSEFCDELRRATG